MNIRTKINLSFLTIFVLVSSLVGLVVGIYTTNLIKKNIYSYLHSGSQARAEHIRTFIKDQEKTSVILAAASVYIDLLNSPTDNIIKSKIDKRMARTLKSDPEIYEAFILDKNGKIIASSDKTKEGLDRSSDTYFTQGKEGVFFKDVYYSDLINKLTYSISAPIKDDFGNFLGISVLRYLPENFFSIVKNENPINSTEENFLVDKDKFFISPSLFLGEDVILKQKVETQNVNDCFDPKEIQYVQKNGYSGLAEAFGSQLLEAKDYRNVDIIATHSYIPETGWCLITKTDKSDLMSFRTTLILIFLSIFTSGGLIYLLIGFIISRSISKPIKDLALETELLTKEFSTTTTTNNNNTTKESKDEISILKRVFDLMAVELRKSYNFMEDKIRERTGELEVKTKDLEEQKSAILNILEDIEKEKEKTELLANDLEKFKLALDNASDHVVITDKEGIVLYGNKVVEKVTGYSLSEVIGKKAGTLWHIPMPKTYYENFWDIIKNKKQVFIGEIQNHRKNGEIYTADISVSPVLDKKGEVIYYVGVERDVTKERQIDKAKTEFVSIASHQLRTPLTAINWYVEMLQSGDAGKLNTIQKKYLEEVGKGSDRMVKLVNNLLNISRIETGRLKIEPVMLDMVDFIEDIIKEIKPWSDSVKREIVFKKSKIKLPKIALDRTLFYQVIHNILTNAVRYSPNTTSPVTVALENTDGEYIISVSDEGIGIPKEVQDKIFSKFFRADNAREVEGEGSGIGMYISKSVVDASGGKIWFESPTLFKNINNKKVGYGTTFHISLPVSGMKIHDGEKSLT